MNNYFLVSNVDKILLCKKYYYIKRCFVFSKAVEDICFVKYDLTFQNRIELSTI